MSLPEISALLHCPSDHPTDQRPYLAEELDCYLVTGRVPQPPSIAPR